MFSKTMNTIYFIFFLMLINLSFCSESEKKLKGEYLEQYQEHKTYIFQTKLSSCLSLISASLRGPEGNPYLRQAIKKTKLDRNKFYEKYTMALITQCINNVNEGQLDYLLIPENVDAYDTKNATLVNLIKLNYEISSLELTPEENEVKKVIDEIMEQNDKGKKKSNSWFSSLNYNTILKILCSTIPFILFFVFQSRRMVKKPQKKEVDEGTKEMLELIKQRGKNSPNYKEPEKDKEKKDEKTEEKKEEKTEDKKEEKTEEKKEEKKEEKNKGKDKKGKKAKKE